MRYLLILLGCPAFVFAQSSQSTPRSVPAGTEATAIDHPYVKPAFHFSGAAGYQFGSSHTQAFYQASAGVRFSHFYTGLGVGYDAYQFKTLPVFADLRVYPTRDMRWFGYANIGLNPALGNGPVTDWSQVRNDITGRGYIDLGLGFVVPVKEKSRVLVSAGWSRKEVTEVHTFQFPCGIIDCNDTQSQTERFIRAFNRLAFRIAYEFGK